MKKLFLFAVSALMMLGSCTQDEMMNAPLMGEDGKDVIVASFEGQSGTRMTEVEGVLSWEASETFVLIGDTKEKFQITDPSTGTFSGNVPNNAKYAVYYPADDNLSVSDNMLSITLAAEYTSASSLKIPMWGTYENGAIQFKHLGAALKVSYNNIPLGYTTLVVEASSPIAGPFEVNLAPTAPDSDNPMASPGQSSTSDETPIIAIPSESTNEHSTEVKVTITSGQDGVFYIPLPVGTYQSLKVSAVKDDGNNIASEEKIILKEWSDLDIKRKGLYRTTATYVSTDATTPAGVTSAISSLSDNSIVDLTEEIVANEESILLPDADATYNFNQAPQTSEESPLKFGEVVGSDGSNVNINMPAEATGLYAEINTPNSTIALEGGTYESLTATTAENTLIIGEGVTIKKLIVKGGNVVINGKVEKIENENNQKVSMTVTNAEELIAAIAVATEITLGEDITASEIITINKAITLDGNGKTLTSTADRAINVDTEGSVTIQNLKVVANGERAINIIDKVATVNVSNVTATAKNNAIMIATSAGAANLTVEESNLTGAATIQIAGAGTIAAITDTQITSVDNSSAEGYAPITVFNTADNAKIIVTGGSITLTGSNLDEGASAAYSDANGVSITFSNVTGVNTINYGACYIPYSNQTSYGFTSLTEALEWAKGGETIVLAKDITITANTEISANITIDGNNYSVSTNTEEGVAGKGKGVFLLTGGTIKNVNFTSPNTQYDIIVKAGGSVIEGCKFETASVVTDAAGTTTYGKRAIYTGSSVELTGNLTVTGCTFDDKVYAFNFLSGKNKMDVTFEDCTLGGWLSGTGNSHKFINCTFKKSGDYANYIPYCPATFNGCTFDNGFTISVKHGSTYAFDTNCKYKDENETEIELTNPNSLQWDFSGSGTDNGSNETVTIGGESNKWTIEVGDNDEITWKSSSNEGGSDA